MPYLTTLNLNSNNFTGTGQNLDKLLDTIYANLSNFNLELEDNLLTDNIYELLQKYLFFNEK